MSLRIICRLSPVVVVLMLSLGLVVGVHSDIGGGSGRIKSPYAPGKPVLADEVTRVKKTCARTRTLQDVPTESSHVPGAGSEVGLAFVRGESIPAAISFAFKGKSEQGAATSIDFSEVESFWIVQRDNRGRVLIEVVQFPLITPEELVSRNPSYSDLFDHNRKTVRMWINTKSAGKDLSLVGKDETKRYRLIARLDQIPLNSKLTPDYGTFVFGQLDLPAIWWAIESVTRDEKYPHKIKVAA